MVTGWDILPLVMALSTWRSRLAGRAVHILSNDCATVHALGRDHAAPRARSLLFDQFRHLVSTLRLRVHIVLVPTAHNIAGPLSRGEYGFLQRRGAVRAPPYLDSHFDAPELP